jgi:hypothetical protein
VIDRDGGHAAPVVDPRVEQEREVVLRQVGGRLYVNLGAEHDSRDGDGPQLLLERGVRVIGHPRPGLGAEVLDDHLAEVPVLHRELTEREQRVDPLLARLADADQDPAREGDREFAGESDRLEPAGGKLVR